MAYDMHHPRQLYNYYHCRIHLLVMCTQLIMLSMDSSLALLVRMCVYLCCLLLFTIIYTVTDAEGNIVIYQYQPEGKALLDNGN